MARYRSLLEAESTADESEAESPIAGEGGTDTHKGRADKSGGEPMEKGGANLDAKDKKAEEQPDIAKKKDADAGTGKHHPSTSPEDVKDIKESDDAEEDDDEDDISEEDDDEDGKKAVNEVSSKALDNYGKAALNDVQKRRSNRPAGEGDESDPKIAKRLRGMEAQARKQEQQKG